MQNAEIQTHILKKKQRVRKMALYTLLPLYNLCTITLLLQICFKAKFSQYLNRIAHK